MPSDRYRSRSLSKSRYLDKKGSRRSKSPYRYRSRSRSGKRGRRSRSPQRFRRRSPGPHKTRRRSPSPHKTRRRSPSPHKTRRRSPSPHKTRRRSPSPHKTRRTSKSPLRKLRQHSATPERTSRSRTPKRFQRSVSRTPERFHRSARKIKSSVSSESSGSPDHLFARKKTNEARPHSPATLDDVLMKEKAVTSNTKPSLSSRYDKYDINVISLHKKGKSRRSSADIDNDGSPSGFFPTDVIELVHKLNASDKKKSRSLFDREEIKNFVEEEEVETKVIRLLPSKDELKELEAKLSKGERTQSKSRVMRSNRNRSDELTDSSLRREPERHRRRVTDDDLMDTTLSSRGETSLESDRHKRSIRDRLGSMSRETKSNRKMDERLGRARDPHGELRDGDLRRNLSSRSGRDGDSHQAAPVIREYGHKSLSSSELKDSTSRTREPTPDFSKRPDKGKVDMKELDPTYVPRGGFYDEHDDRTIDRGDWRGRGEWGGRSRGYRSRGGRFGRGEEVNRIPYRSTRDDRQERRSDTQRIVDRRMDKFRKSEVNDTWKHDKFTELEDDTKAEPTSTTA